MSNPTDRDVDTLVQRILAEADGPRSPTVERLRARVETLPPNRQAALEDRLRREKVPILSYPGSELPGDTGGSPDFGPRSATAGS